MLKKTAITYKIERITLIREKEDSERKSFSFDTDETTTELKDYKESLKKKYNATIVHLNYTQIPYQNESSK